jgi:membrane fusion protein, copper/silver efflux system
MNARILRLAAYPAVLVATLGVVYVATRDGKATPPPSAAHDHGAPAAGASTTAKPVKLTDADARRIGVTFATATLGSLSREVRTVGQITFDESRVRAIAPKIDGWVERLYVNTTGQPVEQGQPLLSIYSPMLVTAQEELLLARRLQGDVGAADASTTQRAADLVASARRRLAYWDISASEIAEIERSGAVRKTLTLRSPASGYVLEKNVLAGQKIMAGDALYRVADLHVVWVEGEVYEQDLAAVRVGQTVRAEFQALPGEHRTGRISYVYPTLDPATRTVRVRVVLPNHDLRLKPGMYATIRITGGAREAVLTVPRSAVLSTGERSIVFVRDAGGALGPREVALGASNEERIEILRGVTAGETVVASATFLVDAESNLGTALGGMGDMPGMELTTPPKPLDAAPKGGEDHSAHGAPATP